MQEMQSERQAWSLGLEGESGGQHGTHSTILPLTEHTCIHPTWTSGAMTLNASPRCNMPGNQPSGVCPDIFLGPTPRGLDSAGSWLDQRTCFLHWTPRWCKCRWSSDYTELLCEVGKSLEMIGCEGGRRGHWGGCLFGLFLMLISVCFLTCT